MMWRLAATGATAVLALACGFFLIPRQDEYLAMLARDGRYEEASRMLVSIRAAGDRRPQLLMQALLLRVKLGDLAGAVDAAKALLKVQPGDRGAQQILADLLLQSGRLDEHLTALEQLARSHPDPDRISRALTAYRYYGRYDAELALLRAFASSRHLKFADYERLGALLSARGDWKGAARWLRLVDERAPDAESSARLRLLNVLLQANRLDEAESRAGAWLIKWRSPYLAGKLILRVAWHGAERNAKALARLCAERMPEAVFEVAGVLTASSHAALARELLARWADLAREPSAAEARSYVAASLAAGELRRPLKKLLQLVREGAPPAIQSGFAEEVAYAYGPQISTQLLPLLSPEALDARPLLAARIMRAGGNPQLAKWYLDRVDPSRLAPHQQQVWLDLLQDLGPTALIVRRLHELHKSGRLPRELKSLLAGEVGPGGL